MKAKGLEVVVISITIIYWKLTCYYKNICKPVDSSRGSHVIRILYSVNIEDFYHTFVTSKVQSQSST